MAFADITKVTPNNVSFRETSSLNKHFVCDHCDRKMKFRSIAERHIRTCIINRTCSWCNIRFGNRGNLVRHALCVHGDKTMRVIKMDKEVSKKEDEWETQEQVTGDESQIIMGPPSSTLVPKSAIMNEKTTACSVCPETFRNSNCLKYHIRSIHFNLIAKTKSYDDKEINQVWHEKVNNSSKVVEIKKAAHNLLLIRKLADDTKVETIQESNSVLDLSDLYPTNKRSGLGKCGVCNQTMPKRALKKHYDERHAKIQKHRCNNCNKTFKRPALFVRHVCNKMRKRWGRKH